MGWLVTRRADRRLGASRCVWGRDAGGGPVQPPDV